MKARKEMLEKYTQRYGSICVENNNIDSGLYAEYGVKRGLRDMNGEGGYPVKDSFSTVGMM